MERYFFIHIQKTAGSSLRRHLHDIFDEKNLYPPRDIPGGMPGFLQAYLSGEQLISLPPEEQASYELFSGHMTFATSQLLSLNEPVRTFTILRDPIARTLSVLRQKKKNMAEFKNASFEEIYNDSNIFQGQILNHQTKIFAAPAIIGTLSGYYHNHLTEQDLKQAKRNLKKVDVIGLQHDLHTFYIALHEKFGWPLPREEFRENVGRQQDYTNDLIELIRNDNQMDIEFFRYATQLVRYRTFKLRARRAFNRLWKNQGLRPDINAS